MASSVYCTNVAEELQVWSEKLHRLSTVIDHIPSIDKYKLYPQIEGLHIIMTEMDDRLNELLNACPTVETQVEARKAGGVQFTAPVGGVKSEAFDYEFGG